MIRFVERAQDAAGVETACAWIVRRDDAVVSLSCATLEDLADAARARSCDGGAGRLWRRRLLRTLAAHWLDVPPARLVFERRPSGRARIISPKSAFISAASRSDWSVVAVGRAPLGVDLELAGEDIAHYAQTQKINAFLALRRWTAAEACAKAAGCSLDSALEAATQVTEATGWLETPTLGSVEARFHPFADGLAAAVAGPQIT